MNQKQTVFLDTSIQIERALSNPAQEARLNAQLTASTVHAVTSAYVWMEFQRSVVADFRIFTN